MQSLLNLVNGNKTYASVLLGLLGSAACWASGADLQTIVFVGLSGLLGGAAGLRHAISKQDQKLNPNAILGLLLEAQEATQVPAPEQKEKV